MRPRSNSGHIKGGCRLSPNICYVSDRCYTSVIPKERSRRLYSAEKEAVVSMNAWSVRAEAPGGYGSLTTMTHLKCQSKSRNLELYPVR